MFIDLQTFLAMNFRKPQTQDSEEEKAPMLEAHIPDPATFIRLPSQISKRNVVFVVVMTLLLYSCILIVITHSITSATITKQRIHGTRWMWC